jgi:hypothetical protein
MTSYVDHACINQDKYGEAHRLLDKLDDMATLFEFSVEINLGERAAGMLVKLKRELHEIPDVFESLQPWLSNERDNQLTAEHRAVLNAAFERLCKKLSSSISNLNSVVKEKIPRTASPSQSSSSETGAVAAASVAAALMSRNPQSPPSSNTIGTSLPDLGAACPPEDGAHKRTVKVITNAVKAIARCYSDLTGLVYNEIWAAHLKRLSPETKTKYARKKARKWDTLGASYLLNSRMAVHSVRAMDVLLITAKKIKGKMSSGKHTHTPHFRFTLLLVAEDADHAPPSISFDNPSPRVKEFVGPMDAEYLPIDLPVYPNNPEVNNALAKCVQWSEIALNRQHPAPLRRDTRCNVFKVIGDVLLEQDEKRKTNPLPKGQRSKSAFALLRGEIKLADPIHCEAQLMGLLVTVNGEEKTPAVPHSTISDQLRGMLTAKVTVCTTLCCAIL